MRYFKVVQCTKRTPYATVAKPNRLIEMFLPMMDFLERGPSSHTFTTIKFKIHTKHVSKQMFNKDTKQ